MKSKESSPDSAILVAQEEHTSSPCKNVLLVVPTTGRGCVSHEVTKWGMMGSAVQLGCREATGMGDVPRVRERGNERESVQETTAIYRQKQRKKQSTGTVQLGGNRETLENRFKLGGPGGKAVLPGGEGPPREDT